MQDIWFLLTMKQVDDADTFNVDLVKIKKICVYDP